MERRSKRQVKELVADLVDRAAVEAEFYLGFPLRLPIDVFTGTGYAGCVVWDEDNEPVMRLARNILVNSPMAEIMDLFHHELSHVFTPEDTDHGEDWLEVYMELEPTSPSGWSEKCVLHFHREDWRYVGECSCNRERRRDRKPRADWTCSNCNGPVDYKKNDSFMPYGLDIAPGME